MSEVKWPKKKPEDNPLMELYDDGWNACHDAFMSAIKSDANYYKLIQGSPSGGELDEEKVDLCMFNECPSGDELIRRRYAKAIVQAHKEGKLT